MSAAVTKPKEYSLNCSEVIKMERMKRRKKDVSKGKSQSNLLSFCYEHLVLNHLNGFIESAPKFIKMKVL